MQHQAYDHTVEIIMFALDLDPEVATEANKGATRLDIIKHAIAHFVIAKKRICSSHKFGLITIHHSTAQLLPYSITSNTDEFINYLQQLQPAAAAAATITSDDPNSSSSSKAPFDLGSLITAVAPLQQQQQHQESDIQHVCNGTLTVPSSNSSSRFDQHYDSNPFTSSSSGSSHRLRVLLIYARSHLPAPELITCNNSNKDNSQGLALDCLFIHGKPQPGVDHLQEVFSTLEDLVERVSLRSGHHAMVNEVTAGRVNRLLSLMGMLMTHPLQRRVHMHNIAAAAVLDLASALLMDLPSDAANAASGVPIVNPANLPAAAAAANLGMSYSKAAAAAAAVPAGRSSAGIPSSIPAAQNPWNHPGGSSSSSGTAGRTIPSTGQVTSSANPWHEAHNLQPPLRDDLVTTAAAGYQQYGDGQQHNRDFATVAVVSSGGAAASSSSSSAGDGGSSSSSSSERFVEGVPVNVVRGVPNAKPHYDTSDDGVELGYVIPGSSSASDRQVALPAAASAAYCDPAAAAAVTDSGNIGMQGYHPDSFQGVGARQYSQSEGLVDFNDLQGLGINEDLEREELEGLRAALMASAIEAQTKQQQKH